ncbi:hypothetical protein PG2071B_1514 [Bifidobacterium pseudolongum subsp. globosum]|uniref:Uncharacterized protein n=1 Tax=Bifidobacterium pseudolongum subsp. globosum TaxID=1690 RepID=A0A4Q5A4I9_9BIFI|nr:hypothetical protein PG2071B_1514 [Bifidobacterium pseudolongum subsp. globosum]
MASTPVLAALGVILCCAPTGICDECSGGMTPSSASSSEACVSTAVASRESSCKSTPDCGSSSCSASDLDSRPESAKSSDTDLLSNAPPASTLVSVLVSDCASSIITSSDCAGISDGVCASVEMHVSCCVPLSIQLSIQSSDECVIYLPVQHLSKPTALNMPRPTKHKLQHIIFRRVTIQTHRLHTIL